jgi:hypothetical protein
MILSFSLLPFAFCLFPSASYTPVMSRATDDTGATPIDNQPAERNADVLSVIRAPSNIDR